MATKKQKRQAALEKRAAFEEEYRQSGLRAQQKDRQRRAAKAAKAKEEGEKENDRLNKRLSTLKALNEMKRETAEADLADGASLEMECI